MAYIGNAPGEASIAVGIDRFNGTGACTEFQLTRTDLDDAKAIEVLVNNVQQDPDNSYTVTDGLITFSEAPSSGTNNIIVKYGYTTVITYNNITTSQILDGAITSSKIADGTVIAADVADGSITVTKVAFGTILDKANSSAVYANSAFLAANTPSYTANSAASYANSRSEEHTSELQSH